MYDFSFTVSYQNNSEYRECLRRTFRMDITSIDVDKEALDPETLDELLFDDLAASNGMDWIFSKTKDDPLFFRMYEISAGFMFSTDVSIGLCVLMAYDYFELFHACLRDFFAGSFDKNTASYVALHQKLTK